MDTFICYELDNLAVRKMILSLLSLGTKLKPIGVFFGLYSDKNVVAVARHNFYPSHFMYSFLTLCNGYISLLTV